MIPAVYPEGGVSAPWQLDLDPGQREVDAAANELDTGSAWRCRTTAGGLVSIPCTLRSGTRTEFSCRVVLSLEQIGTVRRISDSAVRRVEKVGGSTDRAPAVVLAATIHRFG